MAYVRKRGNQLAIVHGTRDPQNGKVEQHVLYTLYSKPEALEILGRGRPESPVQFTSSLEEQHPDVHFDWDKIRAAIEKGLDTLPPTYDYVGTRLREHFRPELRRFARRLIETDPQWLTSSWELIEEHRQELEFIRDLIDWRLKIERPTPTAAEWMADNPFCWRYAMSGREGPSEAEDFARRYYEEGDLDKAEVVFSMLTEMFDGYAEGYNYLGLIAFDREDSALAIKRFQKGIELGRKLFPKRVAKDRWWSDHATRPYMRGLSNLALTYNHAGLHEKALEICERLKNECHDDIRAATHEAAARLSTGDWQGALDAALHIHQLCPEESLTAALAAHELARVHEARVWFLHATMNRPRTVAMILDEPMPRPKGNEEVTDHDGGVAMHGSIGGYFERRRPTSQRFFASLWSAVTDLRVELEATRRRWEKDRTGEDRAAFDRIQEMCSLEFATRHWSAASRHAPSDNGHGV